MTGGSAFTVTVAVPVMLPLVACTVAEPVPELGAVYMAVAVDGAEAAAGQRPGKAGLHGITELVRGRGRELLGGPVGQRWRFPA